MEPSPWAWQPGWPELAATAVLLTFYAASQRRYRASTPRRVAYGLGIVLLVLAFSSPVETIATTYLLTFHLIQNVVVAEWAPALLVLGLSPAAAAALARYRLVRFATRPIVALPLWVVTYAVWHAPPLYDAALRNQDWLLPIEHACYLLAGLALWWPVFQQTPWALGAGAKSLYLFAAFALNSPIGLLLALLPSPIYSFYEEAPRLWGVSPLRDQQLAGIAMAGAEAILFFALFAFYLVRFLQEEEQRDAGPGRTELRG